MAVVSIQSPNLKPVPVICGHGVDLSSDGGGAAHFVFKLIAVFSVAWLQK